MKKIYLLTLVAAALAFTSCTIEKRHYMDGYHVEWKHKASADSKNKIETEPASVQALKAEPVNATPESPATVAPANNTAQVVAQPGKFTVVVNSENGNTTTNATSTNNQSRKAAKQIIRQHTFQDEATSHPDDTSKVLMVILAILLPPVAMWLYEGSWNHRCWVNLLLTLLCVLPGIIHALVIIIGDK